MQNKFYILSKLKNDTCFKLKCVLRDRFRKALKNNYKTGSAVKDLGCSIEQLKQWLESQFQEGMTWENYGKGKGKWNIDHIVPVSTVDLTDKKQLKKVCHWFNLRPLWENENNTRGNRV